MKVSSQGGSRDDWYLQLVGERVVGGRDMSCERERESEWLFTFCCRWQWY